MSSDVNELRELLEQRERDLRASERRFCSLINNNADGIIIVDSNGRLRFMNLAAESLFGRSAAELIGAQFGFPIVDGETTEIDVVRRGGETVTAEMRVVETEWEGETAHLASLRDITDRKRAEHERAARIREQAAREEAEAASRRLAAMAVENARLYNEAQKANRLKDEFLTTLSHELRTPLTALLGWTQLLRTHTFDQESLLYALETIERNAKSQNQVIEDVLDVSKIVTGKLQLKIQPVNLVEIIEAAIESVRPAAEAKAIELRAELDRSPGLISGDADRLHQVVWNLLANAIKFTPKQGRVMIQLQRDGNGATSPDVEIIVTDTGQGISREFLPHVFERFLQADGSSTRTHGGLGLGLAIARHVVEMHGGTVHADSPGEGCGATFTARLPLR